MYFPTKARGTRMGWYNHNSDSTIAFSDRGQIFAFDSLKFQTPPHTHFRWLSPHAHIFVSPSVFSIQSRLLARVNVICNCITVKKRKNLSPFRILRLTLSNCDAKKVSMQLCVPIFMHIFFSGDATILSFLFQPLTCSQLLIFTLSPLYYQLFFSPQIILSSIYTLVHYHSRYM